MRRAAALASFSILLITAQLFGQTDVIRGHVTTPEGDPLAGVRVTATSLPGNVTRTALTNPAGQYQIAFPNGSGDYIMGFSYFGYSFRQYQIKRIADEDVLVADARLQPMVIDTVLVMAQRQERVERNIATPDVSGTERGVVNAQLPADLRGDIAAMAATLPGVLLVPGLDGNADGFSVLGLSPDQNSVTLNGLPTESGNLPRDAVVRSTLTTSPYDVARGGFSGANFNTRSMPGSNMRVRGVSLVGTTPQMQWTDPAARAVGNDYTNLSLGGVLAGPLKFNKAFYNISVQLGRQSRDNQTLLNTSPLGLQTAGVASDSVNRLMQLLQAQAIPIGTTHDSRVSDNGSVLAAFDFSPPSSSTGTAFGITANASWRKQTPVSGGVLQLGSASGDRTNWNGGLQARHNRYIGMVLSETSLGVQATRDYAEPYLELPGGRVRISSIFDDGTSGVQSLAFGGNQNLSTATSTLGGVFQNTLSWFDDANRHRIKLTTEVQYSSSKADLASNLKGSFYFNSLADLEAGVPASFTRTLSARARSTGVINVAVALGDSYRRSEDLQLQYGVRLETSRYTTSPQLNSVLRTQFGVRNDELPAAIVISPRIGFSWTVGQAQEIASFMGAARVPRAVVRGGIGVFANQAGTTAIAQVLDNTGLPTGATQIVCVGPAAPVPDWAAYAANEANIPNQCADGSSGTVFSNTTPNVSLFANDYAPQRTVRSNLSWNGRILQNRFALNAEATYSLNLNQQRFVDLNFNPTARFSLGDDGRPVFVAPASIVTGTGAVAASDARVAQEFARLTELRSDLRSRTLQLQFRLNPVPKGPTKFYWSFAYTYAHMREQVSGYASTAADPRIVEWGDGAQGPHSFNYNLRYRFFDALDVSWNGTVRSGMAFTPSVAGDINGDGYSNDRAFVPAMTDAALRDLLALAPGRVRECLERQAGGIAARNSCRGPWQHTASLNVSLDRAKFRLPNRGDISFSLSNPLGAADLLVNGSRDLKGWGQTAFQDPILLYVRGFDPAHARFQYEVNQRFGTSRPQFMTMRSPVTLTATVRFDLGPTREKQLLQQTLAVGRTLPGTPLPEAMYRSSASGMLQNPVFQILRSQDTLQLTALQADSMAAMNRTYTYRADSLWTDIARDFAGLPRKYDEQRAYSQYLMARRQQVQMLTTMTSAVRDLLTREQRRKLPPYIVSMLDPRYLMLVRDGTSLYISGGGMGFMPSESFIFSGMMMPMMMGPL
ncbi:MAG TPA: carboxypeptidase-like regulatory domain-containing protein [Longimicrobiales bacterium]